MQDVPPLLFAAGCNHRNMVQFLQDKKADVYTKNDEGQSLLHLAVKGNNIHAVRILLEEGLNPNGKDTPGKTPLELAQRLARVGKKNNDIIKSLENHIPITLWWAVLTGNLKTANKILGHCKKNNNTAKVLQKLTTQERATELAGEENKDIIKAIQETQAIGFACGGGIAAIIGIPVAITLLLTVPMTAVAIAATTIASFVGIIGLTCIGFALYHGFKEIPASEINELQPEGAAIGAESLVH